MCLPLSHPTRRSVLLLLMSAEHLFEEPKLAQGERELECKAQKESGEQHVADKRWKTGAGLGRGERGLQTLGRACPDRPETLTRSLELGGPADAIRVTLRGATTKTPPNNTRLWPIPPSSRTYSYKRTFPFLLTSRTNPWGLRVRYQAKTKPIAKARVFNLDCKCTRGECMCDEGLGCA